MNFTIILWSEIFYRPLSDGFSLSASTPHYGTKFIFCGWISCLHYLTPFFQLLFFRHLGKPFDMDLSIGWRSIKKFILHGFSDTKIVHRDIFMTSSVAIVTINSTCYHGNRRYWVFHLKCNPKHQTRIKYVINAIYSMKEVLN